MYCEPYLSHPLLATDARASRSREHHVLILRFSNRLPGIRLIAIDSYRELYFPTASARREFMNRVKRLLAAQILSVWVGAAFGPPDRR